MLELTESSAAAYLASRGWNIDGLRVTSLGGGVSNTVLLCECPADPRASRLVLKQALGRLRVAEEWLADRDRVLREARGIEIASRWLAAGAVPAVLWTDREHWIYAMSAAPLESRPWKELLFAGESGASLVAREVARILGALIRGTWESESVKAEFGSKRVFDQLRLDAYYRFTAGRHPDLAGLIGDLVERTLAANQSLVHGDWSPKNLLIGTDNAVMAIDFEVVHFGDPAFDIAFLLNHLVLKFVHLAKGGRHCLDAARAFWETLRGELPDQIARLEESTLRHLPVLMLARVDGKSPAEYLRESDKHLVRRLARQWILAPPSSISELLDELAVQIPIG